MESLLPKQPSLERHEAEVDCRTRNKHVRWYEDLASNTSAKQSSARSLDGHTCTLNCVTGVSLGYSGNNGAVKSFTIKIGAWIGYQIPKWQAREEFLVTNDRHPKPTP